MGMAQFTVKASECCLFQLVKSYYYIGQSISLKLPMKYLLPVNITSVIAKRTGGTKETAEPCSIPRVARQESFGRNRPTSGGTIGKRHVFK